MRRRRYRRKGGQGAIAVLPAIAILLTCVYLVSLVNMRVRPIMTSMAESRGRSLALKAINEAVNNVMAGNTYNDLVIFERNPSGEISAVSSDIIKLNKLKADLSSEIQSKMSDLEMMKIAIPLGNLMDNNIMSGWGPPVNLRVMPVGYAQIDVTNHFRSAGINQTEHEISLLVKAGINVFLPIAASGVTVETSIPLAQTIIIGNVPETYTNIEGTSKPTADMYSLKP